MLIISSTVCEEIFAHAREGYPNEVCGLLIGKATGNDFSARREVALTLRTRNIEPVRKNDRYQIDPADMVQGDALARQQGWDLIGFYHSHPDHPAIASPTDLEQSSPWGGYSYPIVSVINGVVSDLRSWYREGDSWVEEPIGGTGELS